MYLGGEPAGEHAPQSPALLQESRQEDEQRRQRYKASIRSSRATPTRMITVPVSASIGRLSARMRLREGADPEGGHRDRDGDDDQGEDVREDGYAD